MVLAVGIEPTTYRLQGGCSTVEPCQHLAVRVGIEPTTGWLTATCTTAVLPDKNFGGLSGGDGWIRTNLPCGQQIYSLPRLTLCAASPRDGDQYGVVFVLVRLKLVCAAGIEPATSCSQDTRATTALRTEIGGRGRDWDFMRRIVSQRNCNANSCRWGKRCNSP